MLNASELYEQAKFHPTLFRPIDEMLEEPREFQFKNVLEIAALFDTVNELVRKMNIIEEAVNQIYEERHKGDNNETS